MKKFFPLLFSLLPALMTPFLFLNVRDAKFFYDSFVLIVVQWAWIAPITGWLCLILNKPTRGFSRALLGLTIGLCCVLIRMAL